MIMVTLFLLIALAVLIIVVLVVKKPKAGLIVLGGLVVVVGSLFFLRFAATAPSRVEGPTVTVLRSEPVRQRSTDLPAVERAGSVERSDGEGAEWSPESNQFEADVYPSARAAAGALAGRANDQVDKVWQGEESPTAVTVAGPDWPHEMVAETVVPEPALFLLVPLIALVVLVIFLLVKKPKAGLIVLGALVVVGALAAAFFWAESPTTPSIRTGSVEAVSSPDPPRRAIRPIARSGSEGAEWSPESNQFEADVYPSARAAAGALAGRANAQIDKVWQGEEPPTAVTLTGPDWPAEMERLKQVFRSRWPQAKLTEKIAPSSLPENPKAGELSVAFRFMENGVMWAKPESGESGRAVLAVRGPAGTAGAEAPFVRKPWADNFSKYLAENPHPGQDWFVVTSPVPCASATEARNRANQEAARRVALYVRQALNLYRTRYDLSDQALAGRIEPELKRRRFVQDEFLQRFHRPYGDVWKQSLLIQAHPMALNLAAELSSEYQSQAMGQARTLRSTWARTAFSIVGLVVLISLVYLFLNAVTKGYYAWPLRKAAVVAGLLALAAVFALLVLA